MTKESRVMLEAAAARVEEAIEVLEEAQEILAQNDEENFEFPVGIIFSAQTSLRVVSELVRDVTKERQQKTARKAAKKPARAARKTAGGSKKR